MVYNGTNDSRVWSELPFLYPKGGSDVVGNGDGDETLPCQKAIREKEKNATELSPAPPGAGHIVRDYLNPWAVASRLPRGTEAFARRMAKRNAEGIYGIVT